MTIDKNESANTGDDINVGSTTITREALRNRFFHMAGLQLNNLNNMGAMRLLLKKTLTDLTAHEDYVAAMDQLDVKGDDWKDALINEVRGSFGFTEEFTDIEVGDITILINELVSAVRDTIKEAATVDERNSFTDLMMLKTSIHLLGKRKGWKEEETKSFEEVINNKNDDWRSGVVDMAKNSLEDA